MRTPRSVRPAHALAGVLLAAALAVGGCSAGADSAGSGGDDKAAAAPAEGAAADAHGKQGAPGGSADGSAGGAEATAPPKATVSHIIRTASLTVRVEDVPKALDEARATTENAGGYVGNETTRRDEEGREHTRVVLRVPVDRYAEVLADLEGAGRLVERRAKAEDVTDQVVDVESRIKSQRASVARVRELMDRATKLSDVVTLEGELSTRQANLESLLAQQASLKDRTSLATITLSLSGTSAEKTQKDDDDPGFVDALAGGWDVFLTLLRWLTVVLGAVLPFAAVAALLVLVWLKAVRPLLPRRPRTATPPPAAGGRGDED
ncbi:lipoprotein [Streptomyces malachitofuscus]|nr:lipoprotein [Streptomyces malachitofuscus]